MKKIIVTGVLAISLLAGATVPTFAKTTEPSVSAQKIKEAKAQAVTSMNDIRATVKSYKPEMDQLNALESRTDEMRSVFKQVGLIYVVDQTNSDYMRLTQPIDTLRSYLSNEQVAFCQKEINTFAAKGNAAAIKKVADTLKKNISVTAKKFDSQGFSKVTNTLENSARGCTLVQIEDWFPGQLSTIENYYEENGQYMSSIETQGFDIITHFRKPLINYTQYTAMANEVNGVMDRAKASSLDQINKDLTDWIVQKPTGLKYLKDLLPAHLNSEIDSLKKENDNLKSLSLDMQNLRVKYLGE